MRGARLVGLTSVPPLPLFGATDGGSPGELSG